MIHTMKNKELNLLKRRIFFSNRAMTRAQNPEWKDLWKKIKKELSKNL